MADNFIDNIDTSSVVGKYLKDLAANKYNPGGIQRVPLAHLRSVLNGKVNVVDPTNPFVFLLEASSLNTAAAIIDNEANTRKQYPSLAQTEDELYLHMSDKDYIDRFASPVSTVFTVGFLKSELINSLVEDVQTGIRKITIPRNTVFSVDGYSFSLQYPVDIKQMLHGDLEITYDTTVLSPLQTLSTNRVNWRSEQQVGTGNTWIVIEVDVQQFNIVSYTTQINATSGFTKTWAYTDKFCFARVYQKNTATGNVWQELATTHSGQVYDLATPTVNLRVNSGLLQVTVPQIYFTNNLIRGDLRVDIYQTKGAVNVNAANYGFTDFSAVWTSIDRVENNEYVAPLSNLTNLLIYCDRQITGGKEALTFEQLRSRVIRNSTGVKQIPITPAQALDSLENEGYEVVKNTDVVTDRLFLATKSLPTPFDERLITAAASSIETVIVSMSEAVGHALVKNNGLRITLVPEILYRNDNGIITMVPDSDVQNLKNSDPQIQADAVTAANYLYTPFHYVLDNTKDEFEVRPYYLNGPQSKYITFISQNDTTMLMVNTRSHEITKTVSGYVIRIVARGNLTYNSLDDSDVSAQLSFVPVGESTRCYLNGVVVGRTADDDKVFEFVIDCNLDVDSSDNLYVNNFLMFDNEPKKLRTLLSSKFDILYTTTASMGGSWSPAAIDQILGDFILPPNSVGITNERLDVLFGYALKTLWARSRTSLDMQVYRRYETDVPLLYETPVYKKDPTTGLDFTLENGVPVFNQVLHNVGDPVLNELTGLPVLKFKVGDTMTDSNGQPIPEGEATVSREVDIMFVEGSYYFATDVASATYRSEITNAVVQWLTNDLVQLTARLLDETRIYFYPKTNMGTIRVMVEDGREVNINAGHSFILKMYVNKQVYDNGDLRSSLSNTAIRVIDGCLRKNLVSKDDILDSLKTMMGTDVMSFDISGLGNEGEYSAFTVLNEGDRASLKKRLTALPNNKLIVSEDVRIDFIRHVKSLTD